MAGYEQMGALLLSIEKVTYLTNRCAIYERLYTPGTTPEQVLHNLHTALVRLYAAILRLIGLAHRMFVKNTVARAMHAVFNPGDVSDLLAKCQDLEPGVDIEAQNCERMRSQEVDMKTQGLLESLQTPIIRTDERVSSFLEKIDEKERLEILDWISKVLYGKNHDTVKDQRTKNTCGWLLKHSRYLEWQEISSSVILWLHGTRRLSVFMYVEENFVANILIAGTGKTHLASKVVDQIQGILKNNPNHEGLAFFYCNQNETDRQEPLSILRSFVRQLSTIANDEDSMQKRLRQFYIQSRQKATEPTIADCKDLILEFINLYPKTTLVLDALDECDKHKRHELIGAFDYFLDHALRPVKIFISSRPDGDIKERFKSLANIEIQATDNHHDISKFVKSEITKHRRWAKISAELQDEIIQILQDRSQGMQVANLIILYLLTK